MPIFGRNVRMPCMAARCFVLQLLRARTGVRPWIAMAAAYALALQVLLSGVMAGHVMAAVDASTANLFVICHGSGNGPSDDQGLPDQQSRRAPCVLCTLTPTPCAILPIDHDIARVPALVVSSVVPGNEGRVFQYDSPTGRYQRGPPPPAIIFG
jgi:hypothetical protein